MLLKALLYFFFRMKGVICKVIYINLRGFKSLSFGSDYYGVDGILLMEVIFP